MVTLYCFYYDYETNLKLLTEALRSNEFGNQNTNVDCSAFSEVVNPSSQFPHHKHARRFSTVLHSVGKTKLNFDNFEDQSEHGSRCTSG